MCSCVCVCVCVCVFVCLAVCLSICLCACVRACMHVRARLWTYVRASAYAHARMHACMNQRMRVHMQLIGPPTCTTFFHDVGFELERNWHIKKRETWRMSGYICMFASNYVRSNVEKACASYTGTRCPQHRGRNRSWLYSQMSMVSWGQGRTCAEMGWHSRTARYPHLWRSLQGFSTHSPP